MDKPTRHPDRSSLPPDWGWANWSRREEAKAVWEALDERVRQAFRVRFMYVDQGAFTGKRVSHWLVYEEGGVGKAKVTRPSPGWRAWYFRDGKEHFVAHITDKADEDHETDMKLAQSAKQEHMAQKAKPQSAKPPMQRHRPKRWRR